MHDEARHWVERQVAELGPFATVLEIGSRDINGGVRDLFPSGYTGLDIAEGDGVDIVADAADWRPDKGYDCVVSCEVFEHTPRWREICATAFAALKPQGVAILTMAGPARGPHSGIDGLEVHPGEHYENVAPDDLERTLRLVGFTDLELGSNPGDLYAVARRCS